MKLIDKMKNKIRCPVCGKFTDSESLNWSCRDKPGDITNSLNNFLWCCRECITETTYWELYSRDYRVIAHASHSMETSSVIILRPYYDGLIKVGSVI